MFVPMSASLMTDNADEHIDTEHELSWDELDQLINLLPKGYGKVFRLAVLDGLSHKEIGVLLGIAPHSSSSQLAHAKALLRRMIAKYRIETGILAVIGVILLIWHGIFKREANPPYPIISKNTDNKTTIVADSIADSQTNQDQITTKPVIYKTVNKHPQKNLIADVSVPADSTPIAQTDSVTNDTIRRITDILDHKGLLIAQEDFPHTQSNTTPGYSFSLAYSGNSGQDDLNRYRMPDPSIPNVEGPTGEIEVTEKARHHMPLVIGLSINKSLTSRWSMETGLRYTFLRSDFLSESELMHKETIQRIHYIGVPLKLNYRIFTYNGFSLYGQGGGALDIPVYGTQSIFEYSPKLETINKDLFHINAPLQWSVEGGLGIQYHFTPSFSIYAEPSFRYYFNTGSDIKTIRQDKPFEFTIPIGLRLTW